MKLKKIDTGTEFFVFNAHWNGFSDPSGLIGHQLQEEKTQEVIGTVSQEEPIIFTGDLNSINTSDRAIEYLTSPINTLTDLNYPLGFRKFNTPLEWNVDRGDEFAQFSTSFTIDYILTSDENRFHSALKVQRSSPDSSFNASDHYAVVETMILPGEKVNIVPANH